MIEWKGAVHDRCGGCGGLFLFLGGLLEDSVYVLSFPDAVGLAGVPVRLWVRITDSKNKRGTSYGLGYHSPRCAKKRPIYHLAIEPFHKRALNSATYPPALGKRNTYLTCLFRLH